MSVPNTDSFKLSDVVDEINAENPTVETLQECFDNSTDVKFDPLYKLYKDRLSNFRNYNNPKTVTIRPYLSYTKHKSIYITGTTWDSVRWCGPSPALFDSGAADKHPVGAEGCGSQVYKIWRGYLAFNLTLLDIASEVTIIEVALHSRKVSSAGSSFYFYAVKTNWGPVLESAEACTSAYPDNNHIYDMLTGTKSSYNQSDSSYVYKLEADSYDISFIQTNCLDRIIYIALINGQYDYLDAVPPVEQFNFDLYKGNNISQALVWNTELRVKYWGFSFLNAYPDPCDKGSSVGTERIFVTANDGNTWSAYVTTGSTWLSITGLSVGTGSYKFEISLTANTGVPRSGVITIYSDAYTSPYLVNVEQESVPTCEGTPDPYQAAYNEGNKQFQVIVYPSTNSWTAILVDTGDGISWISFVGEHEGGGDGNFTVNIDDNDGVARSCDVKLESNAATDYIIDINQDAGGISGGSLDISDVDTTDSLGINVTPNSMNTTSSKKDTGDGTTWFTITLGVTANGDFTLSIEVFGIPPHENKAAQVRIMDDDSSLEELISVNYTYTG